MCQCSRKKRGHSWLTAVKSWAFRSPTKDSSPPDKGDEIKREKRRWLFRKASRDPAQAIEVAAAAAEAAVATAQAAVEIIRLTRASYPISALAKRHDAATLIQTVFRGYLARRALVALRGIVKLQALIRGQKVRKQAQLTLKYMHALLRVQASLRHQQARLSHDGGRLSMFAETNNSWGDSDSATLADVTMRKSMSNPKERSCGRTGDEWRRYPQTLEDLHVSMQARKEATLERETPQAMKNYEDKYDQEEDERTSWVDKYWMATKQWDSFAMARSSTEKTADSIKILQVDTMKHSASNARQIQHHHKQQMPAPLSAASPRHRHLHSPVTPSPSKNRPVSYSVRPGSPRRMKEEKSFSTANTPSIRSISSQRLKINTIASCRDISTCGDDGDGGGGYNAIPSYMAATESAKARVRSQSAPRQRPLTTERERGALAKKRLNFPEPEPYCTNNEYCYNMRSPSFKSLQAGYLAMEQQSNQSCYTDSLAGEISPCSTTDLRRWLR